MAIFTDVDPDGVGGEDSIPVSGAMTVGTGLRVSLGQVKGTFLNSVVHRTTGGAMIMTVKVTDMTVNALTGAVQGRPFAGATGCFVTGLAAGCFMNIADRHKRCNGRGMTADTVGSLRSGCSIHSNSGRMVVGVSVEVGSMTLAAVAAAAAVDRGVAVGGSPAGAGV